MPELKFNTSADLTGLRQIADYLEKIHAKVKATSTDMQKMGAFQGAESASGGIAVGGGGLQYGPRSSGGGAPAGGQASSTQQGPARRPRGGHKPQYDLSTQGGVIEYYDNVLAQALPMLSAMNPAGAPRASIGASHRQSAGGLQNVSGMVPLLGSNFKSRHMQGSTPYYEDYFNRIGQADVQSMMSPSLKQSYLQAQGLYIGGRKNTAAEFYQNYASEANQPSQPSQVSRRQSLWQHFARSAKGNGIGGILSSGLRGAAIGTMADSAIGGGSSGLLGGAVGGGAAGVAMQGGMATLGAIAIPAMLADMVFSVFKSGYSNWQQTAPTSSQLAHGLGTVGQGANVLNLSIQKAAAAFGIMGTTALQSAQVMAQAFGGNNASVTNLTGQSAQFAMYNGLSDQQQTQIMSAMATMGITSGRGAALTPYAGNRMLTQLTQASHMQGRQGPLFTGLTSIYGTLASSNPTISNPAGVAGQYAAMNASGIQGLQGMRGAQLISQMDSSLANAKGFSQLMGFSAIMKASGGKITNPYQMMSILGQGTAALIPGTKTTVGAAIDTLVAGMGGNKYTQAGIFGAIMGLSENQSLAVRKSHALEAGPLHVPQGGLHLRLTQADKAAIAAAQKSAQAAKTGQTVGGLTTGANRAGATLLQMFTNVPNYLGDAYKQATSILSGSYLNHPISQMVPYAQKVSKQTGMPADYLLAQWSLESTGGTSTAARLNENLAGIKPFGSYKQGADTKYAGFSSLAQFAQADTKVLMQPQYAHARALAQHGASAQTVFSALASEGYTGSPTPSQANTYGSSVESMLSSIEAA
ncbi:MAG: glucosaminidase domain-containing protein, partial [Acidobacteriaceae bacterium]